MRMLKGQSINIKGNSLCIIIIVGRSELIWGCSVLDGMGDGLGDWWAG